MEATGNPGLTPVDSCRENTAFSSMFSPACNHELQPRPALRSAVQSFVCPQTRKCYADWFILLWGVSKKETSTSLPVPVLPGMAGTRPGGAYIVFPLTSEQLAKGCPRETQRSPASRFFICNLGASRAPGSGDSAAYSSRERSRTLHPG